ncbi:hypothetical protein [Microbacterium sp. cx-55]|nr:hypothetical protein [Microbacterium sp. cx-55]
MFVFVTLSILIALAAAAGSVHAVITDRPAARRHVGDYDSRRPSP